MINPGLQRISQLLAHTPLPWRAIHVAGTNGKGSICAYISAMLDVYNKSAYVEKKLIPKLRHGRFTSPHLIDRWDCICIDGKPVTGDVFRAVEHEVLQRDSDEKIGASEFEVLTATAFEIFNREKIDVGVVEVGMGGAEDATNVIGQPAPEDSGAKGVVDITRETPLVTIISKIGLDHQAFLGNTLEEIARQKAGIIKPHVPVIFDPSNAPEVKEVIRSQARGRKSPDFVGDKGHHAWSTTLKRVKKVMNANNTPNLPQHIQINGTLAAMAVNIAFDRLGLFNPSTHSGGHRKRTLKQLPIDLELRMLRTIPQTGFPGRQQRLRIPHLTGREARIFLDGAHNADSAMALAERIEPTRRRLNGKPITWVLAASDSKDASEIFQPLVRIEDNVVLVEFGPVDGMPWVKAMPVAKLEGALVDALTGTGQAPVAKVVYAGNDVLDALRQATKMAQTAGKEGTLVVAGSLYLVGDVLRLVRDAEKETSMQDAES